jgi:hypothetical protein
MFRISATMRVRQNGSLKQAAAAQTQRAMEFTIIQTADTPR